MNRFFSLISTIMLILVLMSCTSIIKLCSGIKNPKPETKESISGFLDEIGYASNDFYIIKDSNAFMRMMRGISGVPEAEFFDCNGNFIPYKQSEKSCNAGIDSFIDQLMQNKIYSTNFNNINSRLVNILDANTMQSVTFQHLPKSDYYTILYFAKYTGKKLNKEHINVWIEEINNRNEEGNLKMCYLLVSLDFMDFWGYDISDMKLKITGYQ